MARVNDEGYLERRSMGSSAGKRCSACYRDWWLVKIHSQKGSDNFCGVVSEIGSVIFPKEYVGKRVRFKLEVVE